MDVIDRHFEGTLRYLKQNIFIPESKDRHLIIYLDGLRVNKKAYLIASNGKYVIYFVQLTMNHQIIEEIFLKTLMSQNMLFVMTKIDKINLLNQNNLLQRSKDVNPMFGSMLDKN